MIQYKQSPSLNVNNFFGDNSKLCALHPNHSKSHMLPSFRITFAVSVTRHDFDVSKISCLVTDTANVMRKLGIICNFE